MTTEIIISNLSNLLSLGTRYSETSNAFLSNGFTSAANNTYFNAVRFAEGIIIKEDIGEGYAHTFLNGIRIYSLKDKTLLADRAYHCCYYSKDKVLYESREMLIKLIHEASEKNGYSINNEEVKKVVNKTLTSAFERNQLELAQDQLRRHLAIA
jgi:hypothetical protein